MITGTDHWLGQPRPRLVLHGDPGRLGRHFAHVGLVARLKHREPRHQGVRCPVDLEWYLEEEHSQ